ncbi:MAG: hypothetical protein LAP87_19885 [Acidobacteriia bacterium]|nr:hypothetical protein [Terriglobia bacterium]
MRFLSVGFLFLCLAGCNRGVQSNEAVRQGVLDHLVKAGFNVEGMDISITAVQFNGSQADATVNMKPKGNAAAGMSMKYHLEQQGKQWVVKGRQDAGGAPHGGGAVPMAPPSGADSPHGGAGKMPSPEDLPPTGKKK